MKPKHVAVVIRGEKFLLPPGGPRPSDIPVGVKTLTMHGQTVQVRVLEPSQGDATLLPYAAIGWQAQRSAPLPCGGCGAPLRRVGVTRSRPYGRLVCNGGCDGGK